MSNIIDQLEKEQLKQKAAECNWYPEYMKIRMDQWIDGLSWDWCISRQRFYGVPIPVWYCDKCNAVILPEKKVPRFSWDFF